MVTRVAASIARARAGHQAAHRTPQPTSRQRVALSVLERLAYHNITGRYGLNVNNFQYSPSYSRHEQQADSFLLRQERPRDEDGDWRGRWFPSGDE